MKWSTEGEEVSEGEADRAGIIFLKYFLVSAEIEYQLVCFTGWRRQNGGLVFPKVSVSHCR
jgi:hypothetical protein